jgi:hypothetical protein
VQQSRGEFSCAKASCIALQNAWVSDRTLCYLASGKPVVVQDTGFTAHIPPGAGLHAFTTATEAVAALAAIRADYSRACRHARDLAVSHFRAEDICTRLLRDAGL